MRDSIPPPPGRRILIAALAATLAALPVPAAAAAQPPDSGATAPEAKPETKPETKPKANSTSRHRAAGADKNTAGGDTSAAPAERATPRRSSSADARSHSRHRRATTSLAAADVAYTPSAPGNSSSAASDASIQAAATPKPLGFHFGSYGRIDAATDLRGSTPEEVSVVSHGSRIVEPSYLEIDTYYRARPRPGVNVTTVATLAAKGDLFHYTGKFDAQLALRNLYAKAIVNNRFGVWVGSREYRGDDIYLLDYWPLDNLNTVGGGIWFRPGPVRFALQAGVNRLLNPFQYQTTQVSDPTFGSATITQLDRQRFITSAKLTYDFAGPAFLPHLKAILYGETHALPSGTRELPDQSYQNLPSDFGWTLGTEVGAWGFASGDSFLNLFLRYSKGLAAYNELAQPTGFDANMKLSEASAFLFGWSGDYENSWSDTLIGGYVRHFNNANGTPDRQDGWEYILDARPLVNIFGNVQAGVDASYQVRFPDGIDPTALVALDPAIFQIAPMLAYTPGGTGAYSRPQFRLVYRAAYLNEGARDLYPAADPRRGRAWVQYLGAQAEWWFNSTYR